MNQLQIFEYNEKLVADSREVAQNIDKRHDHLMRDIDGYIEVLLGAPNFGVSDFFIESTYVSEQNKTLPCYLLTRKGCEMVANKMTGKKGILFTALYIEQFHKMEQALYQPKSMEDIMIYQLQEMKAVREQQNLLETRQDTLDAKVDSIKDVVALNTVNWKEDSARLISQIAFSLGGSEHIRDVRTDIYNMLEQRFGVSLKTRLTNKRRRMADEGVCESTRKKQSIVDVIADDKKLIEGYIAITKEMAVKNGVHINKAS